MPEKDLTIFSVFHKPYAVPECDFITPIQVGKALTDIDLGFLKDDEGDNISAKNPSFCESTALYWIWKNLDKIDSKYIGLAHYRRYFVMNEMTTTKKLFYTKKKISPLHCYEEPLSESGLEKASSKILKDALLHELNQGNTILPRQLKFYHGKGNISVKDAYIYYHIMEDWYKLEHVIANQFPEYVPILSEFSHSFYMHCFNMFVGDKAFVNGLCTFMFSVLDELEKEIVIHQYPYQKRVFGFLSERLVNLYVLKHVAKKTEFPVIFFNG